MSTAVAPVVTVDADALALIEQDGMRAAMDHLLAAVPRLVPGLRSVHIRLGHDWDDERNKLIMWHMRMDPADNETYRAARRGWRTEHALTRPLRPTGRMFHLRLTDEAS